MRVAGDPCAKITAPLANRTLRGDIFADARKAGRSKTGGVGRVGGLTGICADHPMGSLDGLGAVARQREGHTCALPGRALGPDFSTVRLNDALRDEEAKAESAPIRLTALGESVEHGFQVLGLNARPRVADGTLPAASGILAGDGNRSAPRRELHRVHE